MLVDFYCVLDSVRLANCSSFVQNIYAILATSTSTLLSAAERRGRERFPVPRICRWESTLTQEAGQCGVQSAEIT